MIGLMAHYFAAADAVHFASAIVASPVGKAPLPLLMIQGIGDSFTPDITQDALVRALRVPIVGDRVRDIAGVESVNSPIANNVHHQTAGALQYAPQGNYNGHFVVFSHPDAKRAVEHFLTTLLSGTPEIRR